jgi:6-phosphogluconolactonase
MAAAQFDWRGVHIFWVDERCVPPTDGASNYKLVKEYLIESAGIPEIRVHRVMGELAPEEAAARYADDIRAFFSLTESELPRFACCIAAWGPMRTPRACFRAIR